MKKFVIVILSVIIVTVIALMAPPINFYASSKEVGVPVPTSLPSNLPAASAPPLLKIDSNSNLEQESQKLNVPDYKSDFDILDKTLSNF